MAEMKQRSVSAIVVSKGMEGLLDFCLQALKRSLEAVRPQISSRIIVIDNASPSPFNPCAYLARGVELVQSEQHLSFAAANNLAAGRFPADYYLLINNDVLLHEAAAGGMMQLMGTTLHAGICGTRLLFPDGSIQHCGIVFGPDERGPYHLMRKQSAHLAPRLAAEFQAVTGACMLIREEVWQELEGLEMSYPFGLEDVDFCLRARQRGWRVICFNGADSLHFEAFTPGRSQLDVPSRQLFLERWKGKYMVDG